MLQQAGARSPPEVLLSVTREGEEQTKESTSSKVPVSREAEGLTHFIMTLITTIITNTIIFIFITTYKSLFLILGPEPVAPGEEGVGIGCVEPLKVAQVDTEADLNPAGRHKHKASADVRLALLREQPAGQRLRVWT